MNPYSINPPTSEDRFEELCLALMKLHWTRKGLERFGKKGERQFGVDILDTLGESPLYAAQCKLKEQWKALEPSEIETEVSKAKTFPSKLDHYVILTSAKVSTAAQLPAPQGKDRVLDLLRRCVSAAVRPAAQVQEALWADFLVAINPSVACWPRYSELATEV